ncbi:hypothetical protein OG21DRAFT_1527098 [Imleria badia]|nr:hypothetical protein OG21DRAFT_1527098 [Imleria badia]
MRISYSLVSFALYLCFAAAAVIPNVDDGITSPDAMAKVEGPSVGRRLLGLAEGLTGSLLDDENGKGRGKGKGKGRGGKGGKGGKGSGGGILSRGTTSDITNILRGEGDDGTMIQDLGSTPMEGHEMRLRPNGATDDRIPPEMSYQTLDLKREWWVGAKNGTMQELGH